MKALSKFEDLLEDLSTDLTIYIELFDKQESVDVLNNFNPLIFSHYQRCLINSIYSKLAKILDPVGRPKEPNLSLAYFINKYSLESDNVVMDEMLYITNLFKSSNLKQYRNKVLSHNDAKLAYKGESITIKMENIELIDLIETIGNLYFTIKYKAGLARGNIAMDPMVTLPFDQNGCAFIHKLKSGT